MQVMYSHSVSIAYGDIIYTIPIDAYINAAENAYTKEKTQLKKNTSTNVRTSTSGLYKFGHSVHTLFRSAS